MHLSRIRLISWQSSLLGLALGVAVVASSGVGHCQTPGLTVPTSVDSSMGGRKLAPGILKVIPPNVEPQDTFEGPFALDFVDEHPELAWTAPEFPENKPFYAASSETLIEMAKSVVFRHSAWCMEFAFKPVRMIEVDIPQASGKFQRKLVWYMVYRLRYIGDELRPKGVEDQFGNVTYPVAESVYYQSRRALPSFVLISRNLEKEYLDRVIPSAKAAIAARERVGMPLYDKVEMQAVEIKLSNENENHEYWGIATWEDIDPRVDYFNVQIQGITNAFTLKVEDNGDKRTLRKTLQLNFWRPGDTLGELEDKIRFGAPAFDDEKRQFKALQQLGLQERLDYLWLYR